MEDYRSNYKGKVFGIKRIGGFFAVEEANLFGDLSKYDFIMKDRLTYSYNGNHNYCAEVMKEACDEPVFNGWKIDNLYFYGNWYGQAPAFNLINENGEEYKMNNDEELKVGQMVRIINGPMKGLTGRLDTIRNKRHLIVYIDVVGQCIPVHIPRAKVEPV